VVLSILKFLLTEPATMAEHPIPKLSQLCHSLQIEIEILYFEFSGQLFASGFFLLTSSGGAGFAKTEQSVPQLLWAGN